MLNDIRAEVEDLNAVAVGFGIERIRNGTWFDKFIRMVLTTYAQRIRAGGDIKLFGGHYPGLTRDQISEKLCEL